MITVIALVVTVLGISALVGIMFAISGEDQP